MLRPVENEPYYVENLMEWEQGSETQVDGRGASPCKHRRCLTYIVPEFLEGIGAYQCSTWQGCACNEMFALTNRHILNTPFVSTRKASAVCHPWLSVLKQEMLAGDIRKASVKMMLARMSGRTRKRYLNAFASLERYDVDEKDKKVKAFVKFEKGDRLKIEDDAVPRLIQYRSTRYTAALARYLYPVEHALFTVDMKGRLGAPMKDRVYAKGMNSFDIATRLREMDRWDDTVWVLLDHSRFDSFMTTPWLKEEHKLYKLAYSNSDRYIGCPKLNELLKAQLRNNCVTIQGIRYRIDGKKMSGEYNTSLGDCYINSCIIYNWICGYDSEMLINGDDSVVAMSYRDYLKLDHSYFEKIGWKTKIEVVRSFPEVEFCQCRPIEVKPGLWRMVRKPERVLSRGTSTIRKYFGVGWLRLLTSMGKCELAMNSGVPILQSFAQYLLRHGRGFKPCVIDDPWTEIRAKLEPFYQHPRVFEITNEARVSFSLAFGIPPESQVFLEQYFDKLDSSHHVDRLVGQQIDCGLDEQEIWEKVGVVDLRMIGVPKIPNQV